MKKIIIFSTFFILIIFSLFAENLFQKDKFTISLIDFSGSIQDICRNEIKIRENRGKITENGIEFKGNPLILEKNDIFNLPDEFTIELYIKPFKNKKGNYARLISFESYNPRGGYALALKNGYLSFWASGKSWLFSSISVREGEWHKVGVMGKDGYIFLFCDDKFSKPFKAKCYKANVSVFIGKDYKGIIKSIRFSKKARYWKKVIAEGKDWELPEKYFVDNGFRGKVILNGFWGARPYGSKSPYFKTRVPDDYIRRKNYEYYRKVKTPEGWEKREVYIELNQFSEDGWIEINGKRTEIKAKRFYDEIKIPVKKKGEEIEIKVKTGLIKGDVWLKSYPKQNLRIEDTFLITSYRKKKVIAEIEGKAPSPFAVKNLKIVVKISENSDMKKIVKELSTSKVEFRKGKWFSTVEKNWENPELWSREHPNLYYYTVELYKNGKLIDKTIPLRFGFREVWIENGRFVLNGIPLWAAGDTIASGLGGMREQIETVLKNQKKFGFSINFRVNSDLGFEVADEVGYLLAVRIDPFVKINIWDPKGEVKDMTENPENLKYLEKRIKRIRQHPSIFLYYVSTPWSSNTLYSGHTGQNFRPWDYFPNNRNPERAKKVWEIYKNKVVPFIKKIDPTKIITGSCGIYSSVEFVTYYLSDNLDEFERSTFFYYWLKCGRPKPIWATEFGVPFQGHYYIRKTSFQHPHTNIYPKIHLEDAAKYFGEKAYLWDTDEIIKIWPTMPYSIHRTLPSVQKLVARNLFERVKNWRTFGILHSGHCIFNSDCFQLPQYNSPEAIFGFSEAKDPRRPGLSRVVRATSQPILGRRKILPAGDAYKKVLTPLFVYIGGPDGEFYSKDHLYYSGTKIKKAIIVLNDYEEKAKIKGIWEFTDGKRIYAKGNVEGTVEPGSRNYTQFQIEMIAPEVKERTDFEIRIKLRANKQGILEDSFPITVFPQHKIEKIKTEKTIWVINISDERVHERRHFKINKENKEFLEKAGVEAKLIKGLKTFNYIGYGPKAVRDIDKSRKEVKVGIPKAGDLLIIPRFTLRARNDDLQQNLRLLERINLDKLIEKGLNVIVFEQNLSNIFGINTEESRPRQVFIAAEGHPVLKGLKPSDFTFWSGESNLTSGMDRPPSINDFEFPDRLWHVNSINCVATKTLIRPQVGSTRALLVCGFDLMETPLLEVTKGKGRIIFCQLDVTNRYGKDPVATIVVDNLIKYMLTVSEPDPSKNKILKPEKGVIKKKNIFRCKKPKGKYGWGITYGDLFIRESIYNDNWITKKLPELEIPVFNTSGARAEVIRFNKEKGTFEFTLDEKNFKTGWMKRKIAWVKSALVVNQNGSLEEGPGLFHHGKLTDLYPYQWVENFVHPYTPEMW